MSRPHLLWWLVAPSFIALSGCAGIPSDRGFSDVRSAAAARGQTLPAALTDPALAERDATTQKLLAQPLKLDDAVTVALLNNPRVADIYAQLGFAGADVLHAGRLTNPDLSASFGFPLSADAGPRFGFGLAQDFINLLFLPTRSRLTRADFERAKAEAGAAVMDLTTDVARSYYRYLAARQKADLLDAIAQAADAAASYAQSLFDAGNLNRLQLDLQNAASTQAELDAQDAAAERDTTQLTLNQDMGLSAAPAQWQVADKLSLPVAQEDDSAKLALLAISQRLDLQAARAQVASLQDSLAVIRSTRWFFDAQLGADYNRDTDGDRSVGPSISLQLPLFDQGQSRVLRAQAEVERAQAQTETLRIQIANEVQTALARLNYLRRRVELLGTKLVPLRQSVVARTQAQVNYGLVGVFDALQAKQQEYTAEQSYLTAIGDYWLARVALARAVGGRLSSDAQIGEPVADSASFLPQPEQVPEQASDSGPAEAAAPESAAPDSKQNAPSVETPATKPRRHSRHSGDSQ